MSIIKINCIDAANTVALEFPNMDTSIVRPIDISYLYGVSRKPIKGKIWKMTKVGKRTVFDQYSTFQIMEVGVDCLATMEQV